MIIRIFLLWDDVEIFFCSSNSGIQPSSPLFIIHFGKPFFEKNNRFRLAALCFVYCERISEIKKIPTHYSGSFVREVHGTVTYELFFRNESLVCCILSIHLYFRPVEFRIRVVNRYDCPYHPIENMFFMVIPETDDAVPWLRKWRGETQYRPDVTVQPFSCFVIPAEDESIRRIVRKQFRKGFLEVVICL